MPEVMCFEWTIGSSCRGVLPYMAGICRRTGYGSLPLCPLQGI